MDSRHCICVTKRSPHCKAHGDQEKPGMKMDSKALYDLYKPLWEEVPETRPPITFNVEACRFTDDSIPLVPERLTHAAAAALCRVDVEDFLTKEGGSKVSICRSVEAMFVRVDLPSGKHCYFDEGPTIHHALVAAALAVAKARKDQAG